MVQDPWVRLLGTDPRPWLLQSGEPAARWVTLTHLFDLPHSDPDVIAVHSSVLASQGTQDLLARMAPWNESSKATGRHDPAYPPNLLHLLADMGVGPGDDLRVEKLLDQMLDYQDDRGAFLAYGRWRGYDDGPRWASLTCDRHAITEVLVRFGRVTDRRVRAALDRMAADLGSTTQGRAWGCIPGDPEGFRCPGRPGDMCPQASLEALRTFARLPPRARPRRLPESARTVIRAWRRRSEEHPSLFGHGYRFKTVKWPAIWYDLHWMLDTLGRYPRVWFGPRARPEDRHAVAEMVACLVAYNFNAQGRVLARSSHTGFGGFSFASSRHPSPFATARMAAVLRRFAPITADVAAIDVAELESSRGAATPILPRV